MMKLFYSAASPYARKCRIVAIEKNLDDKIETLNVAPMENPPQLRAVNPLGKVPALVLEDGTAFCDSPLICEYLGSMGSGPALIPDAGTKRWDVLRLHALADGVLDAAVATRMEIGTRPETEQSPKWIARWAEAIDGGLHAMEQEIKGTGADIDLGQIGVACALGYLDLRFGDLDWRSKFPGLAEWNKEFAKRPSMVATQVS